MVPGVKPETSLALLKQSIFEIVEYAAARYVRVGMEYEPGLLVERADELEGLILEIGAENFGANLDFGHSHLAGEAPVDVAERLASRIFHIHLEDISGRKHYHLIPGEGDIDFEDIFRALAGIEYDGFVTVELYTCPENPEQAAGKAFDYLRDLFLNRIVT
jgi:sugar phosphate isomerase/epimerase